MLFAGTYECRIVIATGTSLQFEQSHILSVGKCDYNRSSLCKRSNRKYLVTFISWRQVLELSVDPMRETRQYKTQQQIRHIECVRLAGQEVLFATHFDTTVRSYALEENSLRELASVKMELPELLLWDHQRQVLLVSDDERGSNVRVLTVASGGRALRVVHTNRAAQLRIWIWSWCISSENTLLCFDYNKQEFVEFEIKSAS